MLMPKGYYIIRTYTAGHIVEKTKAFISENKVRSKREAESSLKKQEQNEYSLVRRLARFLNGNFTNLDYLVGYDYSPAGYERLLKRAEKYDDELLADRIIKAAKQEIDNYIRRIQRELKKTGGEIKYLGITSDMDGATGEAVRVHHHFVISGAPKQLLIDKWTAGGCTVNNIWQDSDLTRLAEYLIAQVRHRPNAKSYVPSRNLVLEKPKDRIVHSAAEIRIPKGATLLHRAAVNGGNDYQYVRYMAKKEKPREGDERHGEGWRG